MASGAKVMKEVKETRLSGSCVTFKFRIPLFLPEEPECACAVFSEISCVTCIVVTSCIRYVGSIKKHQLRDY